MSAPLCGPTTPIHRVVHTREEPLMAQHMGPEDEEGMQLTYSSLPPGQRRHTPPAALPHDEGPAPGEPGSVRASQGAWPHCYHRLLNAAFLGALFALGVLLGTVVSEYAASLRSLPSSAPMLSRPGVSTTSATQPGAVGAAAVDARFAIVTLGIKCLRDTCNGSQEMPAGQRIYALQAGVSCTTATSVEVVVSRLQYVYCRMDQPNVFSATFDGAPFDCVGSRLGCHFVVQVQTTNGR
jgi:hypothetical protein